MPRVRLKERRSMLSLTIPYLDRFFPILICCEFSSGLRRFRRRFMLGLSEKDLGIKHGPMVFML